MIETAVAQKGPAGIRLCCSFGLMRLDGQVRWSPDTVRPGEGEDHRGPACPVKYGRDDRLTG